VTDYLERSDVANHEQASIDNDDGLKRWLRGLAKVELHVHLEGSMSVETVRTLAARHDSDLSTIWPQGLPEAFSFVDFPDFARQFFYGLSLLRSGEDLVTIVDDLGATLATQNVGYAEVTTTAFTHFLDRPDRDGISQVEYRDALNEGRRRASKRGVELNWVIDIPRDLEMADQTVTIDYVEGANTPDGLVALGLGGYEVGFPATPYAEYFARARAIGLYSVPHAGETEGPDSVRAAIVDLGATRIGHGVRCLEDPDVVAMIVDRGVMLEICPTSNVLLGVTSDIANHPLPLLREKGVRVCLNTDDPGWFATDLLTELMIASDHLGVDRAGHKAMQLDAIDASFAPSPIKTRLIRWRSSRPTFSRYRCVDETGNRTGCG